MMVLAWIQGPAVAPVFLGMMGLSMGMASNMGSALWAERYGVMALGKIKSMVSSLAVFATALSPVIMGLLIDKGWAFDRIMTLLLVCTVLAAALSGFACFNSLRKVD